MENETSIRLSVQIGLVCSEDEDEDEYEDEDENEYVDDDYEIRQ